MKCGLALSVVVVAVALAGCGGDGGETSDEPLVEPAPSTVGTLSEESRANAVVRDMTAVREAAESTQADEAVTGLYALLNRATEAEADRGAEMIRDELPGLAAKFVESYADARDNITRARVETDGGEAAKELVLYVLDEERRIFRSFASDVARSDSTWGAVVRFGEDNNAFYRRATKRLTDLVENLPDEDQAALEQAFRELFGPQAG